jgi:trk system potassium uptake protein TrkA
MIKKQFVVIGLGRFGASIAETLYSLGNDVLAVDKDEDSIQRISDKVTHAIQADAIDENSLRALGISNFDVAIISIGENIQSSIMATLLVKELGVKHIIAKATNALHAKVLYKTGADRVVFPERDMGVSVAHNLVSSNILEYIELSPDYSIAEAITPKEWYNKTLRELNIRSQYGINIVAIKRSNGVHVSPSADDIIKPDDVIVVIGSNEELDKLEILVK